MSQSGDWSPDEPEGTETYEQWDEALDAQDELDPERTGNPEGERSLDSQLTIDDAELEEVGATFDDPEQLALLDGGIDDPDGTDATPTTDSEDLEDGWRLDGAERLTGESIDDEANAGS